MKRIVQSVTGHGFGTFGGVFTPSILTILGVILFMRANYVVGLAGVGGALIILMIAESISLLTGVSLASISTNTPVGGGGAYFVISRVLGPGMGGAIGVALFLAQTFSIPFYVLGFVESVLAVCPEWQSLELLISMVTLGVLFGINWVGSQWAVKMQYIVMTALALAIAALLLGAFKLFSFERLAMNWNGAVLAGKPGFWVIFAIYFPAVTGIMSGVNMSGDLKTPSQSIVRGTFAAIFVGAAIYMMQIVICGGAFERDALIREPYEIMVDHAVFDAGFLVIAGMFAASLSSALGSFMGAPRVLQAMARDNYVKMFKPFAVGSGTVGEPRRAMLVTLVISVAVIAFAATGENGSQALNAIASVVSMFFLCTYGVVNLSAFVEAFGGNPSFRPRYTWFHWSLCGAGFLACFGAMMLINAWAAWVAIVVVGVLCVKLKPGTAVRFGDARQGIAYTMVLHSLGTIRKLQSHAKNWRPTILAMTGNPQGRSDLTQFAVWLNGGRGVVYLVQIMVGSLDRLGEMRKQVLKRTENDLKAKKMSNVYPIVVVDDQFDHAVRSVIQSATIGPIVPNLVLFGWPSKKERRQQFSEHLIHVASLQKSIACLISRTVDVRQENRIDIWWRGAANGSLMLVLAHLIRTNPEWAAVRIRLIRIVEDSGGRTPSLCSLEALGEHARIDIETECIVSRDAAGEVIARHSNNARLVIMGFLPPETGKSADALFAFQAAFEGRLPMTLLVWSNGEADITA